MPAAQDHISAATPLGATVVDGGVTIRFWAPRAESVHVSFHGVTHYHPVPEEELVRHPETGDWSGFFPGVQPGTKYRFYVQGAGGTGFKRDPRARELELYGYPDCDAIVVDPAAYPWHDQDFRPPPFDRLVVYQFHVGVFWARDERGRDRRAHRTAKLLDAIDRVPYLADLGVTAVQPLPVVEFQGPWSLGYNGTDLFSPEMDYCVDPGAIDLYLERVNALLAARGAPALKADQLAGQSNQLRAFVDVCHLYGLAVIMDVVYNHAGGGLDPESLDWIDLPATHGPGDNAYFSDQGWAGGRVFAYHRPEVRRYLIDNARMFLDEYHCDGLRFDEVSVIDRQGGWAFCQEMTAELHALKPSAVLIAEYWAEFRRLAVDPAPGGMGFDVAYADGLRDAVRGAITAAAHGRDGPVGLARVAGALHPAHGAGWQAYTCLENHDLVLDMDDHRAPRLARLADATDARSWYARSRARVAMALLLTAPGTPMLFMGQEFLEDKLWSDSPGRTDRLIWWEGDRHTADFRRCTRDLIRLRHSLSTADRLTVLPPDEDNRVLAFERDGFFVVASLNESTLDCYRIGFPFAAGREAFNSDYYDHFPNPRVAGNGGAVVADGPPLHGYGQSVTLTIPANAVLVFTA